MISITGEMRDLVNNALADQVPCFVATASGDGDPQISMKGSVIVYNDDTLAYWERTRRTALSNVRQNPKIMVFYRNPERRYNWRFHGTATVEEAGQAPVTLEPGGGSTVVVPQEACGDQNGDGSVDVLDAIIDLHIAVERIEPTAAQQVLGDLNRDGAVNIFDAIIGLQHIVGLIAALGECGSG